MTNIEKISIGALGGLSAVLVKFLGQDYANLVSQAANLTAEQILCYKIGYGILTPILMFLGAFVAWISDETKRLKLAAIAIAAPAMITTWSGGSQPDQFVSVNFFNSAAYAQSSKSEIIANKFVKPDEEPTKTTLEKIKDGVGVFFGYGKEPKRYWVIVGSYKNRDSAQKFAYKINAEDSTLNAWVGAKIPPNEYYPVIVGGYNFLNEAKMIREKALSTQTIKDAYMSQGAKR